MNLENYIRDIKDFPKEWIFFKDISPALQTPEAFNYIIDEFAKNIWKVDAIVWLDARGFIFGWALSYKLWIPFIPIRKKWKLPYDTISVDYELEYWKNTFDIHIDAINKGDRVAIVDDLLATGWTAKASVELIERLGWIVNSLHFVINLDFLNWKDKLKWYKINSLLKY